MERYTQLFKRLEAKNQAAFVPFVTLGDPNPETSLQIIDVLVAGGADALEIGIPFSDPLADGPTIQDANLRAFAANVTPALCFTLLAQIRAKYPDLPIGLLMYANLVFHAGIDDFYQRCQDVGIDSVLIADVPLHESHPFQQSAIRHNIAPIYICPPDANDGLIEQIAALGHGYTYLLSRAGVTGTDKRATTPLATLVNKLAHYNAPLPIQGFGISEPQQVKEVIDSGAAGAISGSAVVNIIAKYLDDVPTMLKSLAQFSSTMKAATIRH